MDKNFNKSIIRSNTIKIVAVEPKMVRFKHISSYFVIFILFKVFF